VTTQQKIAGSGIGVLVVLIISLLLVYLPIAPSNVTNASFVSQGEDDGFLVKGGVRRPKSEFISSEKENRWREPDQLSHIKEKGIDAYGWMPAFDSNTNKTVQYALEEVKTKEGKSLFSDDSVFREEEYKSDKSKYLNRFAPFRVFSPAQPGEGIPVLVRVSDHDISMVQGETVSLEVEGLPNMPVTFTSFDGGIFSNELPSISVESDEKGRAKATFNCTPGVVASVKILAASPLATGIVEFHVRAKLPETK
jgi:hypothetical protein